MIAKKVAIAEKTNKTSSIEKEKKVVKNHKKKTKIASKTIKVSNHAVKKLSKSKIEKTALKASNGIITITTINTQHNYNNSIVEFQNV